MVALGRYHQSVAVQFTNLLRWTISLLASQELDLLLLLIVYGICKFSDSYPSLEIWFTFLDISKAFYRVWYGGLIYE